MPYEVQTDVFEGPFDLLLHLILKQEVDLYEVSLAGIVDAYLAQIDLVENCDLDVATEFLLIAATLVELKTRRLLPIDESIDLDDEFGIWEERDLLLSRLLECKTFKDAARQLEILALEADRSYPRVAGMEEEFIGLTPDLLISLDPNDLRRAYLRATAPKPKPVVSMEHVNPITVTVTDAVEELLDELPRVGRIGFRKLTSSFVDRIDVVIRFLAVLELFKQGLLDLRQTATFGDIEVVWIGASSVEQGDLTLVDRYDG